VAHPTSAAIPSTTKRRTTLVKGLALRMMRAAEIAAAAEIVAASVAVVAVAAAPAAVVGVLPHQVVVVKATEMIARTI